MDYYAYRQQFDSNISNSQLENHNFNNVQPSAVGDYIDPHLYNQNYLVPTNYNNLNYDNQSQIFNPNYIIPSTSLEYDLTLPNTNLETKTDDELWIETWLSTKGKIQLNLDSTIITTNASLPKVSPRNFLSIYKAKELLTESHVITNKLEAAQQYLLKHRDTMSSDEWTNKSSEIATFTEQLSTIMSQLEHPDTMKVLAMNIKKRKKKRLRQKRRKIEQRENTAKEEEKRKQMHQEIDQWLENMKESVERAKAEENMKKDADCVLAEVTKKKSDARKQISLINALLKLRNARENLALQRGENTSHADQSAFNNASEKLAKMWDNLLKIYSKEEQGLRIMLEENAIEDKNITNINKEKRIVHEWEMVLFGSRHVPNTPIYWGLTSAERDVEAFISIRKSWDMFLTNDCEQGSRIPIGWVIPDTNSSTNWTKYLYNL